MARRGRRRATLCALAFAGFAVATACAGPPGAAEVPGPSFVVDEPKRCIDSTPSTPPASVPPAAVEKVVLGQWRKFTDCYELGHQLDERLMGTVTTRLTIATDGRVERAEVTGNTLPNCQVVRCVKEVFRSLQFSDLGNVAAITTDYPMTFADPPDPVEPLRNVHPEFRFVTPRPR